MENNKTFIIGDSHATFFERVGFMKSHWTGPIHVATIFQLLKQGLELDNLQQLLSKSAHFTNLGVFPWQCPSGVYDVPNIANKSTVLFSFGFNDIQKNIAKYAHDNYIAEIDKLIFSYVNLLKEYEFKYKITCIPCSIPPNPYFQNNAVGNFNYGIAGDFEANGSCKERNIYALRANKKLKELCVDLNLKFFDTYNDISDCNGFLKKEYTEDGVHLRCDNVALNELIKSRLGEIIKYNV